MSTPNVGRYTVTIQTPIQQGGNRRTFRGIKAASKEEACDKVAKKMGGYHGTLAIK